MPHEEDHFYRRFRQSEDPERKQTPDSHENEPNEDTKNVPWKERIKHFTWAWFTL